MRLRLIWGFLVLTLVVMLTCKQDDDPDSNANFFHCKIDGADYRITGDGAYAVDFGDHLIIYGVDADNFTVYIQIQKTNLSVGDYTFDNDNFGYVIPDEPGAAGFASFVGGGSGKVTLTKVEDDRYEGSFEFMAFDFGDDRLGTEVTDGDFSVLER